MVNVTRWSLAVFFLSFATIPLFAQPFSAQKIIQVPDTYAAYMVRQVDLDGDEDIDIVVVSGGGVEIAWFENQGNGQFSHHHVIAVFEYDIQDIYASDLDNDGDGDIVAVVDFYSTIWLENNGNGQFDMHLIHYDGDYTNHIGSIVTADLDGDGDHDLLTAQEWGDTLGWFVNDGYGNFSDRQFISVQKENPLKIIAADFDEDGDDDIVCSSSVGPESSPDLTLAWYENDGAGNFEPQQLLSSDYDYPSELLVIDLDHDNHLDILMASVRGDNIAWCKNDGSGNFAYRQIIHASNGSYSPRSLQAADLDLDGFVDVICASSDDEQLAWFQNDGLGNFSLPIPTLDPYSHSNANDISAMDVDNDGDWDIVNASSHTSQVTIFKNDGSGSFTNTQELSATVHYPYLAEAVDINMDGLKDIVNAFLFDGKITWQKNKGGGLFDFQKVITLHAESPLHIKLADMDNDGDIDVVSPIRINGLYGLSWFENDGIGNFNDHLIESTDSELVEMVLVGDLDRDGRTDVVVSVLQANNQNTLAWYRNLPGGNFGMQTTIQSSWEHNKAMTTTDLDQDGDIDVILVSDDGELVSDDGESELYAYLNDGSGLFDENMLMTLPDFPWDIKAGDFDNDGLVDLITHSYNTINWYRNEGLGGFGQPQTLASGGYSVREFHISDIDLDGDQDLVTSGTSHVVWYENMGNGQFSDPNLVDEGISWGTGLDVSDLDLDGDRDILLAESSSSPNKISWYENLGDEPFIAGHVFYDENGNSLFDREEHGLNLATVIVSPESFYQYVNSWGYFKFILEPGYHQLTAEIDSNWLLTTSPEVYEITVTDTTFADSLLFGFKPIYEYNDLDIVVSSNAFMRCGQRIPFSIMYRNSGTTTLSGMMTITGEQLIERVETSMSPFPDSISGNQPFWQFEDLYPGERRYIHLDYVIADVSNMGHDIVLEAKAFIPISQGRGDYRPDDQISSDSIVQICHCTSFEESPYVVLNVPLSAIDEWGYGDHGLHDCDVIPITDLNDDGLIDDQDCLIDQPSYSFSCYRAVLFSEIMCAFDPNDKKANPPGIGNEHYTLKDENIIYTIRFQNTGNDTAFHVHITDSLDTNLDAETFQFLMASHSPVAVNRLTYNSGMSNEYDLVTFSFHPISLPDSATDRHGSQGFVMFTVRPKSGVTDGTVVSNSASIVFDQFFEYPVVTNSVELTLVSQIESIVGVRDNEYPLKLSVFPNPFHEHILVDVDKDSDSQVIDIYLMSLDGRIQIFIQSVAEGVIYMDTKHLPNGIYLLLAENTITKQPVGYQLVVKH